ncbi:hypothetical protein ACFX1S_026077 [Malus domestica]
MTEHSASGGGVCAPRTNISRHPCAPTHRLTRGMGFGLVPHGLGQRFNGSGPKVWVWVQIGPKALCLGFRAIGLGLGLVGRRPRFRVTELGQPSFQANFAKRKPEPSELRSTLIHKHRTRSTHQNEA